MVIKVGNFLIVITIFLVAIIILVGISRHESYIELLRFSLVLTVSAIPVALPAVLTVTMAIGALSPCLNRRDVWNGYFVFRQDRNTYKESDDNLYPFYSRWL